MIDAVHEGKPSRIVGPQPAQTATGGRPSLTILPS